MFKLDSDNNLRYIPSGEIGDLEKSPVYLPLGFQIGERLIENMQNDLNDLHVNHSGNNIPDMTLIIRHLSGTLIRYLNGRV